MGTTLQVIARILEGLSACQRLLVDALPRLVAAQEQQAAAYHQQALAQARQAAATEALAHVMQGMLQQQQAICGIMLTLMALLFERQQ